MKYDPENPQNSTDILKPQTGGLILSLIFITIYGAMGALFTGLFRRKIKPKVK